MTKTAISAKAEGLPKFNRATILRDAWAGYQNDKRLNLVPGHFGNPARPFNRAHFAYCLRMAWAVAKELAAKAAAPAGPVATVMRSVNLLDAVTAARVAEIRNELLWQEMDDCIDWTARGALKAELSRLTA